MTISIAQEVLQERNNRHIITGLQANMLRRKMRLNILKLALQHYGFNRNVIDVLTQLRQRQQLVHGKGVMDKWVKAAGKYFFYMYAPGIHSKQSDNMMLEEMNRISPLNIKPRPLRFAFFAITKKCPMKCEHCYEWDNINKKEVLNYETIRQTIHKLKDAGITQLHISGGEPMLRVNDIASIAKEFSDEIEIWVLTSGFNGTKENINQLKAAGVTGLVVSLDHYKKAQHDKFRGFENAFECATNAIRFAREADMVACVSLCCTKEFTSNQNLFQYLELAKQLDVSFIQLLEPNAVGNYTGKDVKLNEKEITVLTEFYEAVNFDDRYKSYPIIMYHGYYQRKVGCFLSANRALFVNPNAEAMACPFCHVSSGNLLTDDVHDVILKMRNKGCGDFGMSVI